MSINSLLIFILLLILRKYKAWEGQLTWTLMIVYSIFRFGIEMLRGDIERGFVSEGSLSTSQFIGIIYLSFSIAGYIFFRKRYLDRVKNADLPGIS